jgi:uncharacterized protein (DUF362 family)
VTSANFYLDQKKVAIAECENDPEYPCNSPFRPSMLYPEFADRLIISSEENKVYQLCRQLFVDLELDLANYQKASWNPLAGIVNPGDKVLVKPNMVRHIHLKGGVYEAVVTHGSLIRCMLDYVALALEGKGEIIVGDAPVQSASFNTVVERIGLKDICEEISSLWNVPVRMVDFRLWAVELDENHCVVDGKALPGDTAGYRAVDLGKNSLLAAISKDYERFRVTSYDCSEMVKHHNHEVNEYLIPKTVLDADVVINLPKLKTHRKVGMTASLKNLVGINGHKDWLPHHRCDSVIEGGDEYLKKSKLKKMLINLENAYSSSPSSFNAFSLFTLKCLRKISLLIDDPYIEGSWYGNDTLWRTVLDLNRVLIYADRDGKMADTPQRRCFTLVDGIIAGEGEGPMEPSARHCGVLVAGTNPVAVDSVLATMIGFDYRKIPIVSNGYNIVRWPLTDFTPQDIRVSSNSIRWHQLQVGNPCHGFDFAPSSGWVGHLEFTRLEG